MVLVILGFVALDQRSFTAGVLCLLLGIAVGGGLVMSMMWISHATRQTVAEVTERHIKALARKRAQTLRVDDYGNLVSHKWQAEVEYFLETVVFPHLRLTQRRYLSRHFAAIATELIEPRVRDENRRQELADPEVEHFDEAMSGVDYEHFCAALLRKHGWTASVTSASGDQGADIVCERNGSRVVVQCKKYGSAVGNWAVQEAVAARAHNHAQFAVVISNSSYTKSAIELANTNCVQLLHHRDIPNLDKLLHIPGHA